MDGSVVNVTLPALTTDLGGGLALQQWVVDAYLITLGSLILIAGSLSDLFGRKRILILGLLGFAITSIMCAVAPSGQILVISRALQGIAGALLVPSSLALIIAHFSGASQSKAIGTWTAWTGLAFIIGPLVGGFLVDSLSWRYIFAINAIPIAVTLWLLRGLLADKVQKDVSVDWVGAVLCTFGLGAPVFALIEQPRFGWNDPLIISLLIVGLTLLVGFLYWEARTARPMLPLKLFKVRNFSVGNIATTSIYAGLSVATFLLIVFVQQVGGYSALASGLSLLPVTIIMFLLSPRFGALAGRYGPRFFMTVGPLIGSLGFLLLLRVDETVSYWAQIFPGIVVFGLGLSMTVAPLTSAVLGSIEAKHAGIGSAVNNAIARIAGLLAIAVIGVIVGGTITLSSFQNGIIFMVILLALGGFISWLGIQNPKPS